MFAHDVSMHQSEYLFLSEKGKRVIFLICTKQNLLKEFFDHIVENTVLTSLSSAHTLRATTYGGAIKKEKRRYNL